MTREELQPLVGATVIAKRLGWDEEPTWDNEIPWKEDGEDPEVRGTLSILPFADTFAVLVGMEPVDPKTVVVED